MSNRKKYSLQEVVGGSVFLKVCAILRENDYIYTHDSGYYNFTPDEVEVIQNALMKESSKDRDDAQDYINFYNALMQYSNFISNSAANYEKEKEKLSMYIDVYEMLQRLAADMTGYATKSKTFNVNKEFVIPYCLERHETGGYIIFNADGTSSVDVDKDGNYLDVMYKQSAKTAHALAVLKAWIEVGKEIIGKSYKNPIMELVPFNFIDYISPHEFHEYPDKYYISNKEGRDSTKVEQKFEVFPNYRFTPIDPDGDKAARSILKITLEQWQLNKEKIKAIKSRLSKM